MFCKSDEESRLCDYLGKCGIHFRYEERYEYDTADKDYRQYCPDFSIYFMGEDGRRHRVYLEYFAVNEQGHCPRWFSAEEEQKLIPHLDNGSPRLPSTTKLINRFTGSDSSL